MLTENAENPATKTPPREKPTRKRFAILAMIFVTVVINYMDRANLSIAATALSGELELNSEQMGAIFAAFGITYSISQIPGGVIVDLMRSRILYPIILIGWSLATLLQGFANSVLLIMGCRWAIGIFEAPSYPINNKVATNWFPENERASAIGIYTSGQFLGIAFLMPVLTLIQAQYGWRGLFIISGLVGIVWGVIWYFFYRDPDEHKGVNDAELKIISDGGGYNKDEVKPATDQTKGKGFNWGDLKQTLIHRKLWGIYIGQFCLGGVTIFFMTWFPKYLVDYRGLDFIKSGYLASLPFIAAFIGILLSGFSSDFLVKSGLSKEVARKSPIILGMLLSTSIIGANYTESTFWIMAFMSLAFFGIGLASIAWVFVSLLAPQGKVGLVGGTFNFIGGLSAFVIPYAIGVLAKGGQFEPALVFVASLGLIGTCSYLFLVGKVERIVPKG